MKTELKKELIDLEAGKNQFNDKRRIVWGKAFKLALEEGKAVSLEEGTLTFTLELGEHSVTVTGSVACLPF